MPQKDTNPFRKARVTVHLSENTRDGLADLASRMDVGLGTAARMCIQVGMSHLSARWPLTPDSQDAGQ